MESGNSASLQSSSGGTGDEEYDSSRAGAALSIFMSSTTTTHSPSHHLRPISPPPPPLFEPVSNYYIPNSSSLNPISNPWTRPATMRSDPNPASSSHATIVAQNNDHLRATAARGSRKRSRATRRDPTTVLTTDTTNFRAMVQEFTGIPSPPFSSTSSSLDLFRTTARARARARSTHLEPPYLRRPSPQTPPPPPFLFSSTAPINNYQLPMPMPMQLIQSSNLFNDLQNPNTTLASLLQSNPNCKFLNAAIPTNEFDDFDFNLDGNQCFTTLGGLPNLISPDKNSESCNYREIKTTGAPVALNGEGMVESWITSSE